MPAGESMTSFHDPVPDRLLGPVARPLLGRMSLLALTMLSLAAAGAAFAAFILEQRLVAGLLILVAAVIDAGGVLGWSPPPGRMALTPRPPPPTGPDAIGMQEEGRSVVAADQVPQPSPWIGGGQPEGGVGAIGAEGGVRATRATGTLALAIDTVTDRYADVLIFAGMAVWARGQDAGPAPLAVGFAAAAGSLGFAYGVVRTWASAGHGPAGTLFGWLGRDLRLLVAAAGALTGLVYPALLVLAIAGNLPVFAALARLPVYLRDDAHTA